MKRRKLISSTWREYSLKFVKWNQLPLGTALHLYDARGRKKRADWLIKRRRFRSMPKALGTDTVKHLLGTATSWLSTDIAARRLTLRLVGPQGQRIHGSTLVEKVRAMPRARTEADAINEEQIAWDIDQVYQMAGSDLGDAEYLIQEPDSVVPFAYTFALVDRYGWRAIKEAVDAARHRLP